jgi:hypothetical protein
MVRTYRIALSIAAGFLLAGAVPASAVARSVAADSATGCLQKGDKPDSFKLVSKDGKTWDVSSKKVSLAGHVGHTVTLTGDVTKSDAAHNDMSKMKDTSMSGMSMGDSSKMSGMSSSSGTMNVTSLAMVSPTCS